MRRLSVVASIAVAILWAALPVLAARPTDYDPYAVGNTWEYRAESITVFSTGEGDQSRSGYVNSNGTVTTEVASEKEHRSNGDVAYLVRTTERYTDDLPDATEQETVAESLDLVSKQGTFTLAEKSPAQEGGQWHNYDKPLFELPVDLAVGKKWAVGISWQDTLRFQDEGRIVSKETIETPAGTFEDCLKVMLIHARVSGTMTIDGGKSLTVTSGKGMCTIWLAPGVGMVRQEELEQFIFKTSANANRSLTFTMKDTRELMPGYKVN